jgi:hypothetical protein
MRRDVVAVRAVRTAIGTYGGIAAIFERVS